MTECVAAHGCITCGDEAVPMTVLKVDLGRALALCADPDGERSNVEIALVEPVSAGEVLLVHAGTALGRAAGQAGTPRDHPVASAQERHSVASAVQQVAPAADQMAPA
jgi:hydrogenase maturation factor